MGLYHNETDGVELPSLISQSQLDTIQITWPMPCTTSSIMPTMSLIGSGIAIAGVQSICHISQDIFWHGYSIYAKAVPPTGRGTLSLRMGQGRSLTK